MLFAVCAASAGHRRGCITDPLQASALIPTCHLRSVFPGRYPVVREHHYRGRRSVLPSR